MLPPKCQNPDCKRGNKQRRRPSRPLRTQNSTGRVRAYRVPGDMTIEDPVEQGRDAGWDNWHIEQFRKMWEGLTPAERAKVEREVDAMEKAE
jgi:hypothetical protein